MADTPVPEKRGGWKAGCVVFWAIIGILVSSTCILSAITTTIPWMNPDEDSLCDLGLTNPLERLAWLAVGLLIGGADLYAIRLITTRSWSDLPRNQRILVVLTTVVAIGMTFCVVSSWAMVSWQCVQTFT